MYLFVGALLGAAIVVKKTGRGDGLGSCLAYGIIAAIVWPLLLFLAIIDTTSRPSR